MYQGGEEEDAEMAYSEEAGGYSIGGQRVVGDFDECQGAGGPGWGGKGHPSGGKQEVEDSEGDQQGLVRAAYA
jgi:hypothetical protein